jgi:hypothetical protein
MTLKLSERIQTIIVSTKLIESTKRRSFTASSNQIEDTQRHLVTLGVMRDLAEQQEKILEKLNLKE